MRKSPFGFCANRFVIHCLLELFGKGVPNTCQTTSLPSDFLQYGSQLNFSIRSGVLLFPLPNLCLKVENTVGPLAT
jgi:hypothetical protein